mgnify:CR=1 FL=1
MKTVRILALLLAVLMIMVAAGCDVKKEEDTTKPTKEAKTSAPKATEKAEKEKEEEPEDATQEPITFSLLMYSWPTWDEPMDADPVGKWITEQTGVTIDVELITGESDEKYSLVLAAQEYPDFMLWPGDSMATKFIEADALVAYDDYLDKLPNVVSRYGSDIGAVYDLNSGHLYRISQWAMGNSLNIQTGMTVRHDIVEDMYGERASKKGHILVSEMEELFKDYKAKKSDYQRRSRSISCDYHR